MLIDTHCHLDAPEFGADIGPILSRAQLAGVEAFVLPGVHPDGWETASALARQWHFIHPACGLHPMFADHWNRELNERLNSAAAQAVAIGEIGLDYLISVPRERQRACFQDQLRVSMEAGLPVIIHCRKAFSDLLDILRREHVERVGVVMHAFSGSPEVAIQCIDLGFFISVAGPVTYGNAVKPLEVVRKVPLDRLLLETDSPDLAPVPHRGELNEPALLPLIADRVAEIKGVPVEEVARVTSENARRLFSF